MVVFLRITDIIMDRGLNAKFNQWFINTVNITQLCLLKAELLTFRNFGTKPIYGSRGFVGQKELPSL